MLQMHRVAPFKTFPGLTNPYVQTLLGSVDVSRAPQSLRTCVSLDDGDQLSIHISVPTTTPTHVVLLVHGLCGSHRSPYMRRIAARCYENSWIVVRMNMRGCGTGAGLALGLGHSGRSDDVIAILRYLKQKWPNYPLTAVGFSLGGNLVIKAVGELGPAAFPLLNQAIAICAPLDLAASARKIGLRRNSFFQAYFLKHLRGLVERQLGPRSLEFRSDLRSASSIAEFDHRITAPLSGFASGLDYYRKCSAYPLLSKVQVPTQMLFADDDPFVDSSTMRSMEAGGVSIMRTTYGGHLGFIGPWATRWLDQTILRWIAHLDGEHHAGISRRYEIAFARDRSYNLET